MIDNTINLNALAQACDTTWGRSSTAKTASYSVKLSIQGDRLIASFAAVVNFVTEKDMILMKRSYSEESVAVINAVIKNVKASYKELASETLKTSEVSSSDSVEIIGFNVYNPKRMAYYRRKTVFELS